MGLRRRRNRTDDDLYAMSGQAIKELKDYEADKKKNIEERAFSLQEDE